MHNKKRLMKIERRRYITIAANKSLSYRGIDKKKCTLSHNSIDDVGSFSYAKNLRPLFCNLIWLIKLEFKKKGEFDCVSVSSLPSPSSCMPDEI